MNANEFRSQLRQHLESLSDRILLRVMISSRADDFVELTGAEMASKGIALAEEYCGTPQSGVILLLLPHSAELFLLHLGLVLMGRLPGILAWPTSRVDPEKYQRNLLHQLKHLPAARLITLPRLSQNLNKSLPFAVTGYPIAHSDQLQSQFSLDVDLPLMEKQTQPVEEVGEPDNALFLQFSGGTTGEQKCVVVTAPMLANQLDILSSTLDFTRKDGVVSWLPLYHDMGLIACFWLPLWNDAPSTQFAATDWLMHPELLFHFLSKYQATFCWLPNFAFAYLAAQRKRERHEVNLAHVRAFINCSEPVRQRSMDAFVEAFSAQGVREDQCQGSYAMAENVFAVTQTILGKSLLTLPRLSVQFGTNGQNPPSYKLTDESYVSSGRPLPDTLVRIRDGAGHLQGDDVQGTIELRSGSMFGGYWGRQGFQTRSLTQDGWYATGDYGFTHDGELFVIGRATDIIIISGANIFPEDIEELVNTVKGIYPGRAVAFGVDNQVQGTQSLAVVAEMRGTFDPRIAMALEHQIRHTIVSVFGIGARYVRVTPERWIVKSTAGKISRRDTRLRFLQEAFSPGVTEDQRIDT